MATPTDLMEMQIALAIADLSKQDKPNYAATARKYPPVNCQTLQWQFLGWQTSRAQANSEVWQCLTLVQEEVFIGHINMLTAQSIPPTSQIVKNLAEEIIDGKPVGKNWTSDFVKQYQGWLDSLYLCTIDNMHIQAEYLPIIKQFFDLVWLLNILLYVLYILE